MGRHPNPITLSPKTQKDPKVGQDPLISASYCAPPSIGYRSPNIGQYDQESSKTWSRANRPPTLTYDSSRVTLV
jgi:hypothetical protein